MPTYQINNHQEFLDLIKHIDDFKRYNVIIRSAEVKSGFTEQQRKELVEIISQVVPEIIIKTVPPLIEAAIAPIKRDIALIMSLPTIKREIAELENNK